MAICTLATVPLLLVSAALTPGGGPISDADAARSPAATVRALEQIGRTQTPTDISAVRAAGGAVLLTDPDTSEVVAAVPASTPLGRALTPITPDETNLFSR